MSLLIVNAYLAEHKAELDEIEKLDDFELQGYKSAPMLCQMTCLNPLDLLDLILAENDTNHVAIARNNGIIRWCREQVAGPRTLQ